MRAIREERKRLARVRNRRMRRAERISGREWAAILRRFGHRCAYCSRKAWLQRDHVQPVTRGGRTIAANIVPACRGCNKSKGNLLLWRQWIPANPHPALSGAAPGGPHDG